MYSYLAPVRELNELTLEQRRFLGGVAVKIPRLIEAIESGSAMARYKLGTRRLEDGRHLELELVARVAEGKWHDVANSWGQVPSRPSGDDKA